jgi:peptide deformylase
MQPRPLKLLQIGEPVLRQRARSLATEEICAKPIQQLIDKMRETMRNAPGVGLAAPQIGESLQLAVIEDRPEYINMLPPEIQIERERSPVPFHVIINPRLFIEQDRKVEFFEGCLSVTGFTALVPRASSVRVECLNERAESLVINARGWYARILQHEIDHLQGTLYIDRMEPRSLTTGDNFTCYWQDLTVEQIRAALDLSTRQS